MIQSQPLTLRHRRISDAPTRKVQAVRPPVLPPIAPQQTEETWAMISRAVHNYQTTVGKAPTEVCLSILRLLTIPSHRWDRYSVEGCQVRLLSAPGLGDEEVWCRHAL